MEKILPSQRPCEAFWARRSVVPMFGRHRRLAGHCVTLLATTARRIRSALKPPANSAATKTRHTSMIKKVARHKPPSRKSSRTKTNKTRPSEPGMRRSMNMEARQQMRDHEPDDHMDRWTRAHRLYEHLVGLSLPFLRHRTFLARSL